MAVATATGGVITFALLRWVGTTAAYAWVVLILVAFVLVPLLRGWWSRR